MKAQDIDQSGNAWRYTDYRSVIPLQNNNGNVVFVSVIKQDSTALKREGLWITDKYGEVINVELSDIGETTAIHIQENRYNDKSESPLNENGQIVYSVRNDNSNDHKLKVYTPDLHWRGTDPLTNSRPSRSRLLYMGKKWNMGYHQH